MTFPIPPDQPSKQELKRRQREAKAIADANRNWFARHKVLTGIGAVVILAGIGGALNQGGGSPGAPAAPAPTTPTATTAPTQGAQPTTPAPAPTEPAKATISNGDHVVGTDIAPGQYRAEVKSSLLPLCTVSQSKDADVMDLRNANEGSVIFTVVDKAGTVVTFSGCDNIKLAGEAIRANPNPITNGDWLVGPELPAGKYRGVVDTDGPIKLGTISQTSKKGDIMDLRNANEGSVVFTVKESEGSVVSFSGFKEISKA